MTKLVIQNSPWHMSDADAIKLLLDNRALASTKQKAAAIYGAIAFLAATGQRERAEVLAKIYNVKIEGGNK